MPVFHYLDLSTAHLTEAEMHAVTARLVELDNESPRVIVHDYGAWVNVWEAAHLASEHAESTAEIATRYPNLSACLEVARYLDCNWINFDRDADTHEGLPTYDW